MTNGEATGIAMHIRGIVRRVNRNATRPLGCCRRRCRKPVGEGGDG